MGFVAQSIAPRFYGAANANDERYWSPVFSTLSRVGINVTPEAALMCSCIYQGVRLISETVGSTTIKFFRALGDDAHGNPQTELANDNPAWDLFRIEPNGWQTPQEFIEVMTARCILWNIALAEILPGARGAVDELLPIDPDRVTGEKYSVSAPGQRVRPRWRYIVRNDNGTQDTLLQDQVFRLRGFGLHEAIPTPLLSLARESIGLWLALERFETGFFERGARPGLVIEHGGRLAKETFDSYKQLIVEEHGGVNQMHRPFITQEGGKLSTYGFNLRDSQATESRGFMVQEAARWLNLPEYKLGGSKQPTFASVEQYARDYVDTTIVPITTRWQQTTRRDVIVKDRDRVYMKFVLESLLRGNTLDSAQAFAIFVQNGLLSENEVRALMDRNPSPGLDEPRRSANQDRGGDPNGARAPKESAPRRPVPPNDDDDDDDSAATRHRRLLVRGHAEHIVTREIAAIRTYAQKLADKPDAFRDWATKTFYPDHAILVGNALQLPPLLVRDYIDGHRRALLSEGVVVLDRWDNEAARELVGLALGGGES